MPCENKLFLFVIEGIKAADLDTSKVTQQLGF